MVRRWLIALVAVTGLGLVGGCSEAPKPAGPVVDNAPPPTTKTVATQKGARVRK
jgi:hypothetical protein